MSQSLARVHIHLIFSTKLRKQFILDNVREDIHRYLAVVFRDHKCPALLINSTDDHIHVLFELSRTLSIAEIVEKTKKSSSQWMKQRGREFELFSWQAGYGAFAVSQSHVESVMAYIANQTEHHRHVSFQEEYRTMLIEHGIPFDEKYVWD